MIGSAAMSSPSAWMGNSREDLVRKKQDHPKWPPYSPDINPIENLWAKLSDYSGKINNIDDLKRAIDFEWHNLRPDFIQRYTSSINRRLGAITKSKGYQT